MLPCLKSSKCCTCLSVVSFLVAGLAFFAAEWYLPSATGSATVGLLTMDTPEKFAAVLGMEREIEQTIVFFNLTNAYELQTVTPPPKPIFKEVRVIFTVKAQAFDYTLSNDEHSYSYKQWTHLKPKVVADGLLEIVQLNTVLPALLAQVPGGENGLKAIYDGAAAAAVSVNSTDLAVGCAALNPDTTAIQACVGMAYMYAALAGEKSLLLKFDGTGALGVGLFVRRTVDQLINGFAVDPLTQQPNPGSLVGYNLYETREALEAALASGADEAGKFTSTKMTGKGKPSDLGKWVSQHSFSNVSATNNKPFWSIPPTFYDNRGSMTSGNPFKITGLRSQVQPMAPIAHAPSALTAGYPPKAQPSAGSTFEFFDDLYTFRSMSYSCLPSCKHESLHGKLNVVKYTFDDSNGHLTTNGVHDVGGTCAIKGTCDYGSRIPSLWSTPLLSPSLPYFGNSSPLLTDSVVFKSTTGKVLAYDEQTMQSAIYIEPFTGAPMKSKSMTQINMNGLSDTIFNGDLYANVFASGLPAVWPFQMMVTVVEASAIEAEVVGSPLSIAYLLMLIGDICGFVGIVAGFAQLYQAYKLRKNARVGMTEDKTSTRKQTKSDDDKRSTGNEDESHSVSA